MLICLRIAGSGLMRVVFAAMRLALWMGLGAWVLYITGLLIVPVEFFSFTFGLDSTCCVCCLPCVKNN
jgi:hypothetical protein